MALVEELYNSQQKTLIFVGTKLSADILAGELTARGKPVRRRDKDFLLILTRDGL